MRAETAAVLRADITSKAGTEVRDLRPFAAGHTADLYLADMADGTRAVIKQARHAETRMDLEAWMLRYLRQNSRLPVPDVIAADRVVLIMRYMPDTGRMTGTIEVDAATHLAALHSLSAAAYGLERDTALGPFAQPNLQNRDWRIFFRDQRLMPMALGALAEQKITVETMAAIENLASRLDQWIPHANRPGLIHGDVWGRNVLTVADRINSFIDPAIYYADPEIELAFITLFSTFGDRFFACYREQRSLDPEFFDARRDIYNLYPLLAHARMFGGKYTDRVVEILDRLVT